MIMIFFSALISMTHAEGDLQKLENFRTEFKNGQYLQAIKTIETVSEKQLALDQKFYQLGISYARLQMFDESVKNFNLAIKEGNKLNIDIYYELGQAYYAMNNLNNAIEAFKLSIGNNFNKGQSLYYIAYIYRLLEENKNAKDYYMMIITDNSDSISKDIKQIARFQLNELTLSLMRKQFRYTELQASVEKYIIPQLKLAISEKDDSLMVSDIQTLINKLTEEFDLNPNKLTNGRTVSNKQVYASIMEKIKYDTNVTDVNSSASTTSTQLASLISETDATLNYTFIFKRKLLITPEFRFYYSKYINSDPSVYQNDSTIMYFNLRNKYEHKFKDQPASTLFDIEYAKTNKDYNMTKTREPYSTSLGIIGGYNFNWFKSGETTLKLKYRSVTNTNQILSNNNISLYADQIILRPSGNYFLFVTELSNIAYSNNTLFSNRSLMARFDYMISEGWFHLNYDLSLSTTIIDTMAQKATKGTETLLDPSIEISKYINSYLKASFNYEYNKYQSLLPTSTYSKHLFSIDLRVFY